MDAQNWGIYHSHRQKHLYGHESVDMIAYYLGLDEAQMRATIGKFESVMAEAVAVGG